MKLLDTKTHTIVVPDDAVISHPPIRKITTQAFYRRLTTAERNALRSNQGNIADLRDDLGRSNTVDLDGIIQEQLADVGLFNPDRIAELLVSGSVVEAD